MVDVFLQARRNGCAAKRFFKRLLRNHGSEPIWIVTDKSRSYPVGHLQAMPEAIHVTDQYANNQAEQSYASTRVRERCMRTFKSTGQAWRFVTTHAAVQTLFDVGRYLVRAQRYRNLGVSAFAEWRAGRQFGTVPSQLIWLSLIQAIQSGVRSTAQALVVRRAMR